ncbi:uncharacterized protein [Nicotiana sylvestris]|uniref:uncharacterized protein n=1 Tax=Nicotiana sylvestris TaxID=4096 RepID=UPI00388CC66A
MVEGSRQWHEKLPFALLEYRTTVRTSVGATPYSLVYGTEAVIPAEVEIPSLRIITEAEIDDDEWVKSRLEQLSLIDEKRLALVCHGAEKSVVQEEFSVKEKRAVIRFWFKTVSIAAVCDCWILAVTTCC